MWTGDYGVAGQRKTADADRLVVEEIIGLGGLAGTLNHTLECSSSSGHIRESSRRSPSTGR